MVLRPAVDEKFAWLLGLGPAPSPPPEDANSLVEFSRSVWRVLPAVFPRLEAWMKGNKRAEGIIASVADRLSAARLFCMVQQRVFTRLIDALSEARIEFCLLKTAAVRLSAYGDPLDRCGLDLDIAVPYKQIRQAEHIALKQGFVQAQFDWSTRRFSPANPGHRSVVEATHYELGFLARRCVPVGLVPETEKALIRDLEASPMWHRTSDGRLACYATIDLHHGLSQEVSVESLVHTSTRALWGNRSVPVPQLGWQLYHLIFKLYWEGVHEYGKGLYQYADIARLVTRIPESEQRRCCALLERQRLEAAGFYVFRRLPSMFGTELPPLLDEFVQSARFPKRGAQPHDVNDLGDMWPKLFGHR